MNFLVINLLKLAGWCRQAANAGCVIHLTTVTLIPSGDEKCDACRAAPQDCWAKKGQRKWLQQLPRNETQGVQA